MILLIGGIDGNLFLRCRITHRSHQLFYIILAKGQIRRKGSLYYAFILSYRGLACSKQGSGFYNGPAGCIYDIVLRIESKDCTGKGHIFLGVQLLDFDFYLLSRVLIGAVTVDNRYLLACIGDLDFSGNAVFLAQGKACACLRLSNGILAKGKSLCNLCAVPVLLTGPGLTLSISRKGYHQIPFREKLRRIVSALGAVNVLGCTNLKGRALDGAILIGKGIILVLAQFLFGQSLFIRCIKTDKTLDISKEGADCIPKSIQNRHTVLTGRY